MIQDVGLYFSYRLEDGACRCAQIGSRCKEVEEASAFSIYKFPNFNTCRQCLLTGSDYCISSDGCVPRGQNACRGGPDHIMGHCPENSKYWNEAQTSVATCCRSRPSGSG